jgi:hypothetical protein
MARAPQTTLIGSRAVGANGKQRPQWRRPSNRLEAAVSACAFSCTRVLWPTCYAPGCSPSPVATRGLWPTPTQKGNSPQCSADAPVHVAFHDSDHVGTRNLQAFAARWLAYALPYRCFAGTLASAYARLGAGADRYAFTVGGLSPPTPRRL